MKFLKEDVIRFLKDIDTNLKSKSDKIKIFIMGGAAMLLEYNSPRATVDIDVMGGEEASIISKLAGRGSVLSKKYKGLFIDVPADGMYMVSEDYDKHARPFNRKLFKNIEVYILDPYDLVLSKISRLENKDIFDIKYLFKKYRLSVKMLEKKFDRSMGTFSEKNDNYHFGLVKKMIKSD